MARKTLNLRFGVLKTHRRASKAGELAIYEQTMHQMITSTHLNQNMQGVGRPASQPNLKGWTGSKSLSVQPSETTESQQGQSCDLVGRWSLENENYAA
jgi:hypothetical protein